MKNKIVVITSLLSITLLLLSCDPDKWPNCISGEGPTKTDTRYFESSLRGVELDISADLYIIQGKENKLKIEAQENILDILETTVSDGIVRISYDKCVKNTSGVIITATIPKVEFLSIDGSGMIMSDTLRIEELYTSIDGSGDIYLYTIPDTSAEKSIIESDIDGSGNFEYKGYVDEHYISIDGSGDIKAYGLNTYKTTIDVDGSGNCFVYVTNTLNVNIFGSGDVHYKGNPPNTGFSISGSGEIINEGG